MSNEPEPSPDRVARKSLVGIDGTSATHHFDRYEDTVYVLTTDERIEHVEHLQPDQLPVWVSYVAERRGWKECLYTGGDTFAAFATQLTRPLKSTSDGNL